MLLTRALLAILVLLAIPGIGQAAVIGQATSITNDVDASLGSSVRRLNVGSNVSGDEVLKTGAGSAALLQFLDATHLSIGALSTVVLDKFIYNPDGTAADAIINITKGAMRFVTGNSNPKNFSIRTGVATIGVRGTDFVVACDGKGTCIVAVTKGVVDICPHPGYRLSDCPDDYTIDIVNNFTLIGPNGTQGAQQISVAEVLRLYQIIADGGTFNIGDLKPNDAILPLIQPNSQPHTASPG
jgi:hypothetical protein